MSISNLNDRDDEFLRIRDVTLTYATETVLITATRRVSFEVAKGERFVLLGQSGCGKSTLLKAVGGYIQPTEGMITLQGKEIKKPGPDRMMVFQEFDQLPPWKTVRQNVLFPMECTRKYPRKVAAEKADLFIEKVGLKKFADKYPHMLSGGMKQRVAIARAMAMEPAVLLMDEPYAALDSLTRSQMQDELLELWQDINFTLLFVTHSIAEAVKIGTRILVLSPHPGRVRAEFSNLNICRSDPGEATAVQNQIQNMLFERDAA